MKEYSLIILLVVINMFSGAIATAQEVESEVDCQYLLIMTKNILENSTKNPSKALTVALDLYNISLPKDIEEVHKDLYDTLVTLLYTMNKPNGNAWETINNLTQVYKDIFQKYRKYAARLYACSLDPQVSATVIAYSKIVIIRDILPQIENTIESLMESESINDKIKIRLSKPVFLPGEEVEIRVDLNRVNIINVAVGVVEWPTMTLVGYLEPTRKGSELEATFTAPYASEIKSLPLYEFLKRTKRLSLAVIVSGYLDGSDERRIAYKVFNVTYRVPQLQIITPETVLPGQNISFTIVADWPYENVSLYANEVSILNTTLRPGENNFAFNPLDFGLEDASIIVLGVKIPPGDVYLGTERSKPIIVSTAPPGVMIEARRILISWTGHITVGVSVNTEEPVNVEAKLGPIRLYESRVYKGNNTISLYATILPITPIKIMATSQAPRGVATTTTSVLTINPLYTALVVFILLLYIGYWGKYESYIFIPLTIPRAGVRISLPTGVKGYSLVYRRIKSRIAGLYYRVLLRLGVPLPQYSQTLREHFQRLNLKGELRHVLWRLLRLAEEDLYSHHKPQYSEALKLLKKVFKR